MAKSEPFFTRKRVRGHATLLAIVVWTLYAASLTHPGLRDWLGQVKGTDFVHEYVLGKIALTHNALTSLRFPRADTTFASGDPRSHGRELLARLRAAGFADLRPLCGASISVGRRALDGIQRGDLRNLLPRGVEDRFKSSKRRFYGRDSAIALPAFFSMVAYGQNPAIALIAFTLAWLALRSDRNFWLAWRWDSSLQAAIRNRSSFPFHPDIQLATNFGRSHYSGHSVGNRGSLLRQILHRRIFPRRAKFGSQRRASRTQALPDVFVAIVLADAFAVAANCFRPVPDHRGDRAGAAVQSVALAPASLVALRSFRGRYSARGSPSHFIRFSGSRARIYSDW